MKYRIISVQALTGLGVRTVTYRVDPGLSFPKTL